MSGQLELITLTVTPEEARKLATASAMRAQHFATKPGQYHARQAREYRDLASKVDRQRSLT